MLVQKVDKKPNKYQQKISDPKISANFSHIISLTQFVYYMIHTIFAFLDQNSNVFPVSYPKVSTSIFLELLTPKYCQFLDFL